MSAPDSPNAIAADGGRAVPRSAAAALWVGTLAAACVVVGIGSVQLGLIPPIVGFYTYALGLLAALVATALGGVGLLLSRGARAAGRRSAAIGIALGAGIVAATLIGAGGGFGPPPINDISTDVHDPPRFADLPDYGERDMSFPAAFADVIRQAYPDLEPLRSDMPAPAAYERSLEVAEELGWEITHRDPEAGRFDARDESALFRFVDDVTVRVQPDGDRGSVIDVRSKSRDGRGDLGANAERIRRFAGELQETPAVASP